MNKSNNLKYAIDVIEQENVSWEFFEEDDPWLARENSKHCAPGLLVEAMRRDNWSDQQVGLLATYVAARSLPCWYLYCDDSMPYESCQYALEYWGWRYQNADAQTVPSEFLEAAVPKDDSGIIDDCRYTDTISASKACSSSSRFIASRDDYDAVCAVFHSYCAYDVTPLGDFESIAEFTGWVLSSALRAAQDLIILDMPAILAVESFSLSRRLSTLMRQRGE